MKRPIRFLCAIIVLSLLCGAFCGGAAALRLERSGDSVIVTREEGDPEFLFVAEYDENGRMTSVRAVGDSVAVSEAEAAKLFRMESGAEPADESIDLLDKFVTAETVGFSAENCPVIEDRTFAEPLRVLHTGGDGGFIRFVNCNFEQGIGVAY